jgi:Ca-activated chloride channel family protein
MTSFLNRKQSVGCPIHRTFVSRDEWELRILPRLILLLFLFFTTSARPDAGTLIPKDKQAPDPTILSLDEMRVEIVIDNGDAHVSIVQIFSNHTRNIEEGTYRFSLPTGSTVSDFAVWDGAVRIPAVILERKRAEQIYDEAKSQAIDPGLLEAGERDNKDPRTTSLFTAKIVPIPAYGTKRLEIEYHQRLTATDFKQFFALPLKPDAGQQQTVRSFKLHFVLHSAHPIEAFATPSKLFPIKLTTNDPHTADGTFEASSLSLDEDFQATWRISQQAPGGSGTDKLEVITHRDPNTPLPDAGETIGAKRSNAPEPGFFEAQLLLADPRPTTPAQTPSRTVILLFDNSLSMQWEKLERTYAALEATLRSLQPQDHFNVLLFNQEVAPFHPEPIPATPENIQQALNFVRASKLRGGTDLLKALTAALAQSNQAQSTQPETSIALLSDGDSDRGETVIANKIAARYTILWKQSPHPPHTVVFAVGDDANLPLLRKLAQNGGFLEPVLSTEPVDFHLQTFLSKLTRNPISGLALTPSPASQTSYIYPLDDAVYPGSIAQWIGEYQPSAKPLTLIAHATRDGVPLDAKAQTPLPAVDPSHPQLPRLWAQARVNALLEQIDREGETAAAIDEIIRLSRRYKFVTPYTSFLAVPRSLLRPRVIRPGDPVLRVRTDAQIASVIALFPFGLTKPLRHLASEDLQAPGDEANRLWETRFLAPPEMKDGTYSVRLILRDTHGNTYNEAKTFVIASTPPSVKLQLPRTSLHRGETLEIHAAATASTRTLTAHIDGVAPVTLRWNPRAQINTGTLSIPADLPIGRYTLTVTAEDIAHNLGSQEVSIDVIP